MRKSLKLLAGVVGLVSLAIPATPASATVNPAQVNGYAYGQPLWLNNPPWTPNAQTMSNQTNIVIARGYGICVRYGARFDMANLNDSSGFPYPVTSLSAFALAVVDDGACTGAIINTAISINMRPFMPNDYGNPTLRHNCVASNYGPNGVVNVWGVSQAGQCFPTVTVVSTGTYPRSGAYNHLVEVYVFGAVFMHAPGNHTIL